MQIYEKSIFKIFIRSFNKFEVQLILFEIKMNFIKWVYRPHNILKVMLLCILVSRISMRTSA